MAQETAAQNDNRDDVKQGTKDKPFTGTRFLVDATGDRQYALSFKDGKPVQPVRVFSAFEGDDGFKPNEKVFAFEENPSIGSTPSGGITVKATAYQISVNASGRPNNIKSVAVEYDATFGMNATGAAGAPAIFTLRAASMIALRETGFSEDFPQEISGEFASSSMEAAQTASGLFLPAHEISTGLAFPPQHPKGAELAREGVKNAPPEEEGEGYKMVDKQTLAETKNIGGGERLKIIFNFEAGRVNEVYTAPSQPPAITGHSFAEHDADSVDNAFNKLKELGGEPKPVKRRPSSSAPAA